ncbi:DUF736 family protein [Geoglobus acetivorans]|uniref:DUF736 family protein n=1 Tax=Geoglobus acetivorans TaxID=565033 RepID=A0ABZ3H4G6_GEOAI|nr:DUF736 family protein [Geoglobus acetivorans]
MKSKKYLSGYVDFGILGKREAYIFKNEKKEKDSQPAFRLVIRDNGTWKEVGVFWVRESKPKEPEEEIIDMTG